eukprot:CAMPEP_0184503032 /NCGR_PEP_ID=MMETSP0113_2-20130426/51641_1 /TAXON_ID=91329 /ORGANISM="Norrisiella sphaerica, Strain BC52" /LENGTH=354 /DNA_ID=CAMNT_0026892439 /DNA_START=241 /DNA_END=1305 /DNA_ORIENTATION=-
MHGLVPRPRRNFRSVLRPFSSIGAAPVDKNTIEVEVDSKGRERLALREEGWKRWNWNGHNINYIQSGEKGTPILLIHGFGAHAYHWRYQIPELSKNHRVYSICMLGYGWSDKSPCAPYSPEFWGTQVADFVKEVIGEKAVLVGNSIGAVTALAAASEYPEWVQGLVMLNAAGKFGDMDPDVTGEIKPNAEKEEREMEARMGPAGLMTMAIGEAFKDIVASAIFYSTRYRISDILKQVYLDRDQVDADLVKSITSPALDPKALGTFQSIYRAPGRGKQTVNQMMAKLPQDMKVLLLWGQQDPWMQPEKADQIIKVCDQAGLECEYVPLTSGHCPQDDTPTEVNENLNRWMQANFP